MKKLSFSKPIPNSTLTECSLLTDKKNSPATITAGEFCFYENLLFFFSSVVFGTIFVLVCKHIENLGTHVKIGVVD